MATKTKTSGRPPFLARSFKRSEKLPFAKPAELERDEQVFYIVGTQARRPAKGRFQEQIVFVIALDKPDGERKKLTMTVAEDREELERFVQEDPENPVGPCHMVGVEANTPTGFYWVIEMTK